MVANVPLEPLVTCRQGQRGEVPAGGGAAGRDAVRIQPVVGRIRPSQRAAAFKSYTGAGYVTGGTARSSLSRRRTDIGAPIPTA